MDLEYGKVRLFFMLAHRFDWKYSVLYDSNLIIHIKIHPSHSLDWLLDYLPDYFLDYFPDYKNSRNRINARILISTGTIVFHERYDRFSLRVWLFFSKDTFFILTYSYYCCAIKEKGNGKSDNCQGEKSYQKLQI